MEKHVEIYYYIYKREGGGEGGEGERKRGGGQISRNQSTHYRGDKFTLIERGVHTTED